MLKKLRLKFVLVTISIVLVMLSVIFGLVYHFTAENLEDRADSVLETLCQWAQKAGNPHERQNVGLPYILMQVSSRGDIFASGMIRYDLSDETLLQELAARVLHNDQTEGCLKDYDLRYRTDWAFGVRVIAFVDISSQEHTLEDLITTSLIIALCSIAAFLGLSILLAKWMVRPVDRAWKQQKQFISDASHELKTPLTVIMSNGELLAEEVREKPYAPNILTASEQMRKLVEGLLELTRVDNGQVQKSFEQLDMSQLTEDAVLPFEPVFFERGLELRSQIQPGITLWGNAQYLRQTVQILLDNGVKYSDPGVVWLRLERHTKNQCILSVYTPGQPIDARQAEKLFDRFYKGDQARTNNGSFGLGLAIAKSAVTEHGGKIWVQSDERGNLFCVLLPCDA